MPNQPSLAKCIIINAKFSIYTWLVETESTGRDIMGWMMSLTTTNAPLPPHVPNPTIPRSNKPWSSSPLVLNV